MQHKDTQPAAWLQAAADKAAGRPIDCAAVLGGYTACVDWPSSIIYKELLAANPKAKVILSVRDSFDAWYGSCMETVYPVVEIGLGVKPPALLKPVFGGLTKFFTMQLAMVYDPIFGGYDRFKDKEHVRKIYEAHLAEVKRVVPPGQLLIFNPKDGWGPLCAFLGKQPPADGQPFPYVNETPEFKERMQGLEKLKAVMEMATWVQWGLVAAAAGVAVAVAARAMAGRGGK
ncbi:hypothetical protein HXX76_012241 [Chlamydomonas incerta]|uniref:Sulfotransferase n=1 Tax=Chlamydomonas incerta TaxID=51695 RepID=A0A835VSG8_CHLIN|nr:hypothetical protein HXX76_012241 [Chlamydomonas incerta]|eukprot:KAG2427587.1 hypothetical protein HXX76_012241 [Chlamydomonas incerta]